MWPETDLTGVVILGKDSGNFPIMGNNKQNKIYIKIL